MLIKQQTTQSELNTALHSAAEKGNLNEAKILLLHGANINTRTDEDWTPLHQACFNGHEDIVEFFLSKNININAKTDEDWTPLHQVSFKGYTNIAKYLIFHGADISIKDINGNTAEDIAEKYANCKIVDLLRTVEREIEARQKILNNIDKQLEHQQRIHDALRRKDPLTMTNKEFLDSLEAEITNGK